MLLRIKGLIPSDKLAIVRGILDSAHFVDGKLSAGKEAVNVKNNEELPQNHPEMARLNNIVMGHAGESSRHINTVYCLTE